MKGNFYLLGTFAVLGVSYASEICPISLRGFMTGWVNVCWSMGGFIATGVTTGTNQIMNNYVSVLRKSYQPKPR